jgi:hypothetical protein
MRTERAHDYRAESKLGGGRVHIFRTFDPEQLKWREVTYDDEELADVSLEL